MHVGTLLLHQLQPQVGYGFRNSEKINKSILRNSTGYIEFVIKTVVHFIICSTTHPTLHNHSATVGAAGGKINWP